MDLRRQSLPGPACKGLEIRGGFVEGNHQNIARIARGDEPAGIPQSPFQRLVSLGLGYVVAVAMTAYGYGRTHGVVGTLHKKGGLEQFFIIADYVVQELLADFQHTP